MGVLVGGRVWVNGGHGPKGSRCTRTDLGTKARFVLTHATRSVSGAGGSSGRAAPTAALSTATLM